MLSTVLGPLQVFMNLILIITEELLSIMLIFQMRNLRHKEIKHWAQYHTEVNAEDGVESWVSDLKIYPPKHYVSKKREHVGLKMNSYPGRAREQVLAGSFIKC